MAHPYRSAGRAGAKSKFKAMLGTSKGAKHMNDDTVVNASTPVKNGIEDVKIMAKCAPKRLDRARGGKVGKGVTVNVIVPPSNNMPPPMPPPMMPKPPMAGPPGPGAMPPGPTPGAGLPMPKARGGSVRKERGGYVSPVPDGVARPPRMPDGVGGTSADPKAFTRASGGRATISQRAVKTQKDLQGRVNQLDPTPETIKPYANPDYVPARARGGYIGGEGKGNKLKQWAQYARKNSYHKKDGGGITKAKLTAGADSGVGRLQHSKAQGKHMRGK